MVDALANTAAQNCDHRIHHQHVETPDQPLTSIETTASEELFLDSESGSSLLQQGLELWVNIFELAWDLLSDHHSNCELLAEAMCSVLPLPSLPIQ